MKKIIQGSVSMFAVASLLSLGFGSVAYAYTGIGSQLDIGARGSNVTNLQVFFADNAAIYPEGLVTGYFGVLTQAAVRRFQVLYGIVSSGTPSTTGYGRVGPTTLARINALIAAGGWLSTGGGSTSGDVSGPIFYNSVVATGNNSATFTFNTNENTTARVVYGTGPVMFSEGDINGNGFAPLGGLSATDGSGLSTSHSITVPNLQAGTVYYYTVIATDAAGNVSVWGPNNTVRTSQ